MKKIWIAAFGILLGSSQCKINQNSAYLHAKAANVDTNLILPPAWAFGTLYGAYTNQAQTLKRVNDIIEHNYPIDAYWIDSWFWSFDDKGKGPNKYIDFVADTVAFPDRKAMWGQLASKNIKGGFWAWDCIFETGNEQAFNDFKSKGFFKSTYRESNPWHNNSTTTAMFQTEGGSKKGTLCGNIDFGSPAAVAYFKQQMKRFFDEGADFIKLDRTSAIPVCKAMFELSQEFGKETRGRGFVLSHTGGQETEEYKKYPGKWTDDTRSDWNVEKPTKDFNSWVPKVAFKENIAMYLDPSKKSSTIPFLTNDMGGFDMGKTDKLDEELYIRWLEFSQFCPIVEVFSQPENPTANLAYLYSQRADTIFKKFSHLRMELFPYIYSYAHQNRLTGEMMMRKIPGQLYEYLFGNEFFVAPVYEQGASTRTAKFPAGKWINYWTGQTLDGGQVHTVSAPIEQIPLFVRQGAIIPTRNYARSIEQGTNDTLNLDVYMGASSTFSLIEDDGLSNDYQNGKYAKTLITLKKDGDNSALKIAPVLGSFQGMHKKRVWKIRLHGMANAFPKLTLNGKELTIQKDGSVFNVENINSDRDKVNEIIIRNK